LKKTNLQKYQYALNKIEQYVDSGDENETKGVTTEDIEVKVEDVPITESINHTKVNTTERVVEEGIGEEVEAEENNPKKLLSMFTILQILPITY